MVSVYRYTQAQALAQDVSEILDTSYMLSTNQET